MTGLTNSANNSYTFNIIQDEQNPAIVENMPTELEMSFRGSPDENGIVNVTSQLDIGQLDFTALGDYKFSIREVASSDASNYPVDNDDEFFFYVSVRNKLDENNHPTGEYIASLSSQVKNHDTGEKEDAIFQSSATRSYVRVTNKVTGNLANENDYFKYRIEFENAPEGDEYVVSGQDAVVNYKGESISTVSKIVVGQDNYIYLKHGQTATIGLNGNYDELPIGLSYRLVEVEGNGYAQYVDGVAGDTSATKTVAVDADSSGNIVSFINHKEGDILTGIVMNVLPYLLAISAIGGLALAWRVIKKKHKETKCSR